MALAPDIRPALFDQLELTRQLADHHLLDIGDPAALASVADTCHLQVPLKHSCAVVMVTTDKVYANQEWDYGYREDDRLGGHDPYSASKVAAEIAIASWRDGFCGTAPHQTLHLRIATARAGNVIGGGD
ncbi:hypothetical protein [Synechococcus sp. UW140]|uniref:hypothetical protein n=1 Tax=Synechococcus sp. UW140 TaxID=368503 RepID=UPI003137D2D5